MTYPRDLIGYGQHPPHAGWPGGARVAVQFVLNYEEGGERSVLHGDPHAEIFLSDIIGAQPVPGRHISMESLYDYGSRAGFWRLHRLFTQRRLPLTVFAVAMALERNPDAARAMVEAGWEVASHGWRWFDYQDVPIEVEREHMQRAIDTIARLTGKAPEGWYTGRTSPNTRSLVIENGSFLYDADAYDDDLPHWDVTDKGKVLVVPYTLDTNDMRFATAQGFNAGDQFFNYLRDAFDVLYEEGATSPKMMSVGLHCRLVGRPARIASLIRFLDHIAGHDKVWVATRADIARHWIAKYPAP